MSSESTVSSTLQCCNELALADDVSPVQLAKEALQEVGLMFFELGWSVGTSSNYSVVLSRDPLRILITASGKDKGALTEDDFVVVGGNGETIEATTGKPSAETMLHVMLAKELNAGAVLHTHSVWGTILSNDHFARGGLLIDGYEMLKGLTRVNTHEHKEWIQIFENSQDIPQLSTKVARFLNDDQKGQSAHGFLLRRHGLYTWGKTLAEARRHVEIFEFLFEVLGRTR